MKLQTIALIALAVAIGSSTRVMGQNSGVSAREAVGAVSTQFGPGATQWLAEVRARGGIPQPNDWEILAFNDRAPRLLHRFWGGRGRAGDAGVDERRYPVDVPVGYFNLNQVGVDSIAAFTIAEGEARKARVSFDSVDYLLRVREYSTEPIWRLELVDASRRLVGKIYLSANNGEVLRTIWVYHNSPTRPDGRPLIVDSAAPGRAGLTSNTTTQSATPSANTSPIQEPGLSGDSGLYYDPNTPLAPSSGAPNIPPAAPPSAPTFPRNNDPTGLTPYNPGTTSPAPGTIPPATTDRRYNDGGIPEPPAIESGGMRDLRDQPDPAQPPVDVTGSEGTTERIPPPPVPQP
ncbi:MAG: hypothetical protein AAGA96_00495 [Verrucomicrobiota bacterium]